MSTPTTPANPPTKPFKAIAAFLLTALGLVVQALIGRGDSTITGREWFVIVAGAVVTAAVTYGVTNPPK